MSNLGKGLGRRDFHVGDCYVWAEIHYLDSATDYREYLPRHVGQPRQAKGDDLVMLDSQVKSAVAQKWAARATSAVLFILLLAALSMHC